MADSRNVTGDLSERTLRLVFVTQDEPFYLPRFFATVLDSVGQEAKAIVILPPRVGKKSRWKTAVQHFHLYGAIDFSAYGSRFMMKKLLAKFKPFLKLRKDYAISDVARRCHVPYKCFSNVNSSECRDWISNHDPDLIISISAPQVFRQELLELPKLGCINLHGAPLPRYQGLMPSFWALANREKETAVTVHTMTANIDEGQILAQVAVPIYAGDSLDQLISRSKGVGAQAILDTLMQFRQGTLQLKPMDLGKASYYGFPTSKDRALLFKAGHRFR